MKSTVKQQYEGYIKRHEEAVAKDAQVGRCRWETLDDFIREKREVSSRINRPFASAALD